MFFLSRVCRGRDGGLVVSGKVNNRAIFEVMSRS